MILYDRELTPEELAQVELYLSAKYGFALDGSNVPPAAGPTPTPAPSETATATETALITETVTPTATVTATPAHPTATQTATASPVVTDTPLPATATPLPAIVTPLPTTAAPAATNTPTPVQTPTETPVVTETPAAYDNGTVKLASLYYPSGTRFFGDSGPRVSGGSALSFTPPEAPALAGPIPPSRSTTITYTYDKLYRLKTADYDSGRFYHYSYDATGNRLTQEMEAVTNTYAYDSANRLTSVDGQAYSYDNNGNLLSDGASTYSYDKANQLTSVSQGGVSYSYAYNGMGNRLQQTVDSVTTSYTLDLNTDLTQVLTDGTDTYLYGLGRIGEFNGTNWTYPLADAGH